jgi:hypothetical protein
MTQKFKSFLPLVFSIMITLPLVAVGAWNLFRDTNPDQVLGASDNRIKNETSITQSETLTPNPVEVFPIAVEVPKPEDIPEPIIVNSFEETEDTIEEAPATETETDYPESTEVEIIYTPEQITIPPQLPEDKIEYTPEEVKLFDLSPDNIIGFTGANLNHNVRNIPPNSSFTVTLPPHANDTLINNLGFYPPTEFSKTKNGQNLTITPRNQSRDHYYIFGLLHQQGCLQKFENLPVDTNTCNSTPQEYWSYALGYTTAVSQNQVYGQSVQGRSLNLTRFGRCRNSNCLKIMLTGGLHGSEWRSGDLTRLIEYINNNPSEIAGQNKEIIIAPFTNPDGTALNTRYNARSVNLNRNFPISWTNANCPQCGAFAASEPETQSLINLTNSFAPRYLISYHAQWPPNGIIFRGDDNNPDTRAFAQWVSDRSGYPIGVFPDFDTVPGDQTVWAESLGIESLIIEATSVNNSDWDKNLNTYLGLLRL